jgi:glycosyltransferase involved in cell wall biosynthesis
MHILTLSPSYPTANDGASSCFRAESVGEVQGQVIESSVMAVYPMHRLHHGFDPKISPATWKKYFCLPGNPGLSIARRFLHAAVKSHARRIHAQHPVSLIHAHAALPCGQSAMLLARDLGIPFIVTVHGLDAFSTRQVPGWFGRLFFKVGADVYGAAARVTCISDQVARRVREGLGGRVRISVVYKGADPSLFSPASSSAVANDVTLSVGNPIPIKGHEWLLRSVAAITASHGFNIRLLGTVQVAFACKNWSGSCASNTGSTSWGEGRARKSPWR